MQTPSGTNNSDQHEHLPPHECDFSDFSTNPFVLFQASVLTVTWPMIPGPDDLINFSVSSRAVISDDDDYCDDDEELLHINERKIYPTS